MSQYPRPYPRKPGELTSDDNPYTIPDPVVPAPLVDQQELRSVNSAGLERHERVVRDTSGLEHRVQSVTDRETERLLSLAKASQLVWLVISAIEGVIGLRVILRLMAANPENSFANLVYSVSQIFLGPFFNLTVSPRAGQIVLEIPSLIAMLVYALVGWAIVKAIWLIFVPVTSRSETTYDRYRT